MAAARLLNGRFPSSSSPLPSLTDNFRRLHRPPPKMTNEEEVYLPYLLLLHHPYHPRPPLLNDYVCVPYARTRRDTNTALAPMDYFVFQRFGRDATVDFIHDCRTQITKKVDKEALDRGVVVVRCRDCGDLVGVVDHSYCLGDGRDQDVKRAFP